MGTDASFLGEEKKKKENPETGRTVGDCDENLLFPEEDTVFPTKEALQARWKCLKSVLRVT